MTADRPGRAGAPPQSDAVTPPNRNRLRTRLAVGLTVSALLVAALVGIGATALASWRSADPDTRTQAAAGRVGDGVAIVILNQEEADAAARARDDALRWMLVALGIALVPAVGVGWLAAGRMLGTVDRAVADVDAAEAERQRRLQEVVHELRTPLAVVGTNLELAATDPGLGDEAGGLVDAARRAAERMRRTVDDLAGHGRLAVEQGAGPVDLAAQASAVVAEHSGPAGTRGVHLRLAGPGELLVPSADRAALHTVLANLAANAVRLAPRGSTITVAWGERSRWAWISVADEGPGLPERLHHLVFERGWRGRHERDRDDDDRDERGLGLTIARQLTEAQGGVITLESEEGAGSTFTVWLPSGPDAEQAEVLADDGIHTRAGREDAPSPA